MKGSAEHSRCTCVDRPHALPMNNYTTTLGTENVFEKTRLPVCFIYNQAWQYIIENDGSSTSQAPTTHYTNTCVKIATDLFFSERVAIANLTLVFSFLVRKIPFVGIELTSCQRLIYGYL